MNATKHNEGKDEIKLLMEANDYLKSAIKFLQRAKENNPCEACKRTIEDVERYAENKMKVTIVAGEIYVEMVKLESEGVIAKKPWGERTKDERQLIKEQILSTTFPHGEEHKGENL